MATNDVTGPEQLTAAKLTVDTRVLRAESQRLIHNSHLLIDRSWDVFARVLVRYIEPHSR